MSLNNAFSLEMLHSLIDKSFENNDSANNLYLYAFIVRNIKYSEETKPFYKHVFSNIVYCCASDFILRILFENIMYCNDNYIDSNCLELYYLIIDSFDASDYSNHDIYSAFLEKIDYFINPSLYEYLISKYDIFNILDLITSNNNYCAETKPLYEFIIKHNSFKNKPHIIHYLIFYFQYYKHLGKESTKTIYSLILENNPDFERTIVQKMLSENENPKIKTILKDIITNNSTLELLK